jgi:hypothetical protein
MRHRYRPEIPNKPACRAKAFKKQRPESTIHDHAEVPMNFIRTSCGLKLSIIILTTIFSFSVHAWDGDQVDNDEKVVFYPSYGYFDTLSGNWMLTIQGHIFEPSTSRVKRNAVISGFEAFTGSTIPDKDEFWSRIRPLVSDNERGEKLRIKLGAKTYSLPQSSAGGRMTAKLDLTEKEAGQLMDPDGWITYSATAENSRTFTGKIQLIQPEGVSVISDIDDTIKITEVYEGAKKMLLNTFIRPPQAAPGMSALYRKLRESGASFHYVSGSPWQLYPMLEKFLNADSFPAGSFNMKEFRANPGSQEFWEFIASDSAEEFKKQAIKDIITSYPHREFILIGDSGEHDPEVYGWAAGAYPAQVKEIYIRNVTQETFGNKRMRKSFEAIGSKVDFINMNDGSIEQFRVHE